MGFSGWADLDREFADRLKRFCAETGCTPTSGYRSPERQAELYRCFQHCTPDCNGDCNAANPPGKSWHEYRMACDVSPKPKTAYYGHDVAARFGLHFPISSESWHCQPIEAKGSAFSGSVPLLTHWFRRVDDDDR